MPRSILAATAALLLAACGSDSPTASGPADTLTGTAATGAPVVGASVTARCSSGATFATTTRSSGKYGMVVPSGAFPCAVQLSGGSLPAGTTALHSFAPAPGIANITPLTDLALALRVNASTGQSLATWFGTPTNWSGIESALGDSVDDLRDALLAAGYTLPATWTPGSTTPITSGFTPDPASDAMDQLLEALATAIADPGSSLADYNALLAAFTAAPTLPAAADPGLTGDGAALGDSDGATGTLNATVYTHTANVQWSALVAGSFGAFKEADDSFDALTRWQLTGLPASVGTYACKSDSQGLLPRVQLQVAGVLRDTAPTGGSCVIKIISVSDNYITGQFKATLVDINGNVVGTVSDGFFRKAAATGGGGSLPEGEEGASFTIDDVDYRYTGAYANDYDGFQGMTALPAEAGSPGYPIGIQIHTLPSTTGTYACDDEADGSNAYRKINMWFYWNGKYYTAGNRANPAAGPAGSSCSITLTSVGDTLAGSFSGTFVASDDSSITVSNGLFRFIDETAPMGVPAHVTAMVGTYSAKVSQGNATLGYTLGNDLNVIIEGNGDITVGTHTFTYGDYTAAGTGTGRESNYTFQMPGGIKLTIYNNGTTPTAFAIEEGDNTMRAVVRPLPAGLVDMFADLLANPSHNLKAFSAAFFPNCTGHALTFTGSANPDSPSLYYQSPGAYEQFADGYSRYSESGGDRILANYYGRLVLKENGYIVWYAYNGNGNEYGEYWTDDPTVIAANCPT
ncbi:MAG: hypothetical protein K0Q68_1092 [Moraxellaceae bacterium]|jgi:hypothetical protein|nr:hypothetical protein [Moraxellaceae bacterium]